MTYIVGDIVNCPDTHPFAYNGGDKCCKYGFENIHPGGLNRPVAIHCNGGPISLDSTCCKDGQYTRCAEPKTCRNWGR